MRTRLLVAALAAAALPAVTPALATAQAVVPAGEAQRFSVVVEGRGPDVILIPGLSSSRAVWRATADRLKATHRVHLVQVAGFAGEPVSGNAAGAVAAPLAEALAGYVASRKLVRPAVIGHSLGGEVALMLAARHPGAVGRIMAVDALPFYPLLLDPAATAETIRPQAAALRDALLAADPVQADAMAAASAARLVRTEATRAEVVAASRASDRGVMARAVYELMTTDLRPELARIAAPVTVLYAYDAIYGVPPAAIHALFADAYRGAATVRLERVDGSYHFIMADQPERFAEAVARFLK